MSDVRVAELKARLSEYLRRVRRGHTVTVFDRDTPIARILPCSSASDLGIRHPLPGTRLQDVPLPKPLRNVDIDVVSVLLEERQVGR